MTFPTPICTCGPDSLCARHSEGERLALVRTSVGFTQEAVRQRFNQYMADNHGDLTDIPRLCEVMYSAGGRAAIAASTEVSDLVPLLQKIERRTARLRAIFEGFGEGQG